MSRILRTMIAGVLGMSVASVPAVGLGAAGRPVSSHAASTPTHTAAAAASSRRHIHTCYGVTTKVRDGDTVDVRLSGACPGGKSGRVMVVRNAAVQSTEFSYVQGVPDECWAAEAKHFMQGLLRHGTQVRLRSYAATVSTEEDTKGHQRYIKYVDALQTVNGQQHWIDADRAEIAAGLALWKPEKVETARLGDYVHAEQVAMLRRLGMWGDPHHCGTPRAVNAQLHAWTVWKTQGQDAHHPNQEAFRVRNVGTTTVNLAHWKVRDSSHHVYRGRRTYLSFPAGTTLAPGATLTVHPGTGTPDVSRLDFYLDSTTVPYFGNLPMPHHSTSNPRGHGAHRSIGFYANTMYLVDPEKNFRAWSMYPCLLRCHAPDLRMSVSYEHKAHQYVDIRNVGSTTTLLDGIVFDFDSHVRTLDTGRYLRPGETVRLVVQGTGQDTHDREYWGERRHLFLIRGGRVWLRTADDVTIDIARWGDGGHFNYYEHT